VFAELRALLALAVAGLALIGADPAAAQVRFFSEGEGEANVEPLWPLHAGARWLVTQEGEVWAEPARLVEGERVLAVRSTGLYLFLADQHWPPEPAQLGWWRADDDGVRFYGQPRRGLLDGGALFVPKTVRVGMHWASPTHSHRVVARELMDTAFGRKPVWFIMNHERGFFESGADFLTAYVEGRGPIAPQVAQRGLFDRTGDVEIPVPVDGLVITPLEAPAGPQPDPTRRATPRPWPGEPIHIGAAYGPDGFIPHRLAATQPAGAGPDEMHLLIHGVSLGSRECASIGGQLVCTDPAPAVKILCVSLPDFVAVPSEECVSAHGTSIAPEGDVAQIPLGDLGQPTTTCPPPDRTGPPCQRVFVDAVFHDANGDPRVLSPASTAFASFVGVADFVDSAVFTEPNAANLVSYGPLVPEAFPRARDVPRIVEDLGATLAVVTEASFRVRFDALDPALRDAPDVGHEAAYAQGLHVRTRPGGRDLYRTAWDGRVDRAVVQADGLSWEHVVDVALPPGHVLGGAVPYGDDQLLIVTNGGFDGLGRPLGFIGHDFLCAALENLDPDAPCTGAIYDYDGQTQLGELGDGFLGDVYAWTVDVPEPEPVAEPSLAGLEVWEVGPDALLCWPPGHGALDTDGWEISGDPARAIPVGDRCAFVVRPGAPGDTFDASVATEVVGPIPGAGRVAVGIHRATWTRERQVDAPLISPDSYPVKAPGWSQVPMGCALLSDGRCVTPYRVYSPFRFLSETHPATEGSPAYGALVRGEDETLSVFCAASAGSTPCAAADLGGAGLWVQIEDAVGTVPKDEVGLLTADALMRFPGYRDPALPAQGGGVLVTEVASGGRVVLRADGSTTAAAEPPSETGRSTWTALSDGRVCGLALLENEPAEAFCVDALGEERRIPLPFVASEEDALAPPAWISSGASSAWLWREETGLLVQLDLALEEARMVPPAAFGAVDPADGSFSVERAVRDAEGQAYLVVTAANLFGTQTDLFALLPEGPERIDVPRLSADPSDVTVALALGRPVVTLF